MKNFLYLLSGFFLLFVFTANAQKKTYGAPQKPAKLVKVTIAKKITVSVPEDFTVMPDEGIASKYPAARKPLGVYTSPNGQIDFSVSEKPTTFIPKDLPLVKDIYKASILRMFSDVQFIRDEIRTINKKDMIVFEFVSTVKDENPNSNKAPIKKYSIVQYYLKGGNVTIFTFNSPALLKDKWQPLAQEIMNSVKIN
ncbi:hypothetical protein [Adhaeribacter soli]|uniref:DUF1795 domain-containing protein n=1 Tax=Adhaeribacter soli TaxID=2607655 RepID=A0A5N1J835_9BACT|nr:hypothetical protein [Adhaeribacter soli]KAA9340970.1 hypothetical protein F0P94_05965 [Adhaeribacter soli]